MFLAAHCVKQIGQSWRLVNARIGDWNLKTNPDCDDFNVHEKVCAPPAIDYEISEIIGHPDYDANLSQHRFDIALLRLDKKVEFNELVSPICLPLDDSLWTTNFTSKKQFRITGLRF